VQEHYGAIKNEKKGTKWICDLNDNQVDEIKKLDKDSISDSKEFLVFVESFGMIDADKIFTRAIETLQDNLEAFEKSLK
ncbi:MAG: hypothetical protein AABX10_05100, partial [Nanoarchaeota archaeon]